ncbi:MAG: GFA family protein [Pseudomonadota bacterium]
MNSGSCLCGAISFVYDGPLETPRYCHCANCRKFSGTSPAAWIMAYKAFLEAKQSARLIRFNSGRGIRCSCARCASPIWFESIDFPEIVGLPLGVFDSGAIPEPEMHLWWDSRPQWWCGTDSLDKYKNGPDSIRAQGGN